MTSTAKIAKLSANELKSYIDRGIIQIKMTTANLPTRIEDTPEYKCFVHLRGKKIQLNEASREFSIKPPTISRWVKKGFIPILATDGQKLLLDKSYMAYCAYVYKQQGPSRGRWAFNENGTPRAPGVNLRKV